MQHLINVYYHSGAMIHHAIHWMGMHYHGPKLRGVYYHS